MKPIFQMFAGYNAWANARLYAAAAQLPDAEYRADHGAFFKSVHGTLNHLLVGDRIWMQRLTGEGDAPTRLDAILFEELAPLRAARAAEDARIVAFVTGLSERRPRAQGALQDHQQAGGDRAGARLRAAARLQSPDASSRPGACAADQAHRRCALARPDPLSARDGHRA